jgi:hypothetical protein
LFDIDGELLFDAGRRRGRRHGREYRLDVPGRLLSATAYRNGLERGLAGLAALYGRSFSNPKCTYLGSMLRRSVPPWSVYPAATHVCRKGE